jgi:eukaryotic-like serine/threonine-protein kinase
MGSTRAMTLSELLDAVLALPPEQRLAWVDALGVEHDRLKPRLRIMLARSRATEGQPLLDTLPKIDTSRAETSAHFASTIHAAGEEVGPYRLVRQLGAGAMGAVWLAARHDLASSGQELVALKLAHMAPRQPELRLRLERERRLLSALDHPNIARLYDAGTTVAGQPYLVLEYVAGEALDAYCQAQQPDLQRRLELFMQVAEAVAHAHERQIVHRDIKPANVIVTATCSARLLDFGIGKLLSDVMPVEMQLSAATGRPLTPAYASPEQVRGEEAGFASDIYSLGVVLYELLTGARPYKGASGNRALREAILVTVPEAPSAVATHPAVQQALRGELDAIVLQALRKRPPERHPSARVLTTAVARVLRARSQ